MRPIPLQLAQKYAIGALPADATVSARGQARLLTAEDAENTEDFLLSRFFLGDLSPLCGSFFARL
jgi:hypothetical protein